MSFVRRNLTTACQPTLNVHEPVLRSSMQVSGSR